MAEQAPEEPVEDIPFWFITYSDVITLMMTFFILLLTFATSEPEKFERMQVAVFGGRGAAGLAGQAASSLAEDSVVHRERPRSSRLTDRGSEFAPLESDPSYTSLESGLAGLVEAPDAHLEDGHAMVVPLALLVTTDERVTAMGHQRLRMLGVHLKRKSFNLLLEVSQNQDLGRALALAEALVTDEGIPPAKIGVGTAPRDQLGAGSLRIVIRRALDH